MTKMTIKEKLIFILSFLWMLHWGTNLTSTILDMVILRNGVRVLPLGGIYLDINSLYRSS